MSESGFGTKSFEERKASMEDGKCTCFPENDEGLQCLKNCTFRRKVMSKISEDSFIEKSDEE